LRAVLDRVEKRGDLFSGVLKGAQALPTGVGERIPAVKAAPSRSTRRRWSRTDE